MIKDELAYLTANGIRFAYFEKGAGPLVLCLHGFPDTPHGFAFLMEALSAQGYRVVAPYMRGYYPSGLANDGDYSVVRLAEDALAIIDALGESSAIVVGHDWGGFAACAAANIAPEKVEKLVFCCVPHVRRAVFTLRQVKLSWYVFFFNLPFFAQRVLPRNDYALIEYLYRTWCPNWAVSDSEIEPVKSALPNREHINAAIGYYRSLFRRTNAKKWRLMSAQTSVPTLAIAGESDGSVDIKSLSKINECFTGPFDFKSYPGVGHFPHREIPQEIATQVLAFLNDK